MARIQIGLTLERATDPMFTQRSQAAPSTQAAQERCRNREEGRGVEAQGYRLHLLEQGPPLHCSLPMVPEHLASLRASPHGIESRVTAAKGTTFATFHPGNRMSWQPVHPLIATYRRPGTQVYTASMCPHAARQPPRRASTSLGAQRLQTMLQAGPALPTSPPMQGTVFSRVRWLSTHHRQHKMGPLLSFELEILPCCSQYRQDAPQQQQFQKSSTTRLAVESCACFPGVRL
jgi:hypothetical protein